MKKNFRKVLSIFLTLLIILSIAPTNIVTKANATDDTITWTFDGETLIVSGTGELSEEYTTTDEWFDTMWDKCVNVVIEEGITSVGYLAFASFVSLEKVEILGDITEIGEAAFWGCENLKEIKIPDSVSIIGRDAFGNCSSLENLNIPDSVSIIGKYALENCISLKNLNIPKNIVTIDDWAFKNCSGFNNSDLVLPDTIQKVGFGAFSGTKIKSLTTPFLGIGPKGADYDERYSNHIGYMFGDEECTGSYAAWDSVSEITYYLPQTLKTVTITKQINESNFENAEKIESIIIKNTVEATEYPDNFAKNCKALESVVFENTDKITRVGKYAFFSCTELEEFVIPENVTEIDTEAFENCVFSSIEFPQGLKKIGVWSFGKCLNITSIVIPDNVEEIGAFAFGGCSNLIEVALPETEPQINEYAFRGTKYEKTIEYPEEEYPEDEYPEEENNDFGISSDGTLTAYFGTDTNIVVPEGVKKIGRVFAGNTRVKSIVLPDGLEKIDNKAFDGCLVLEEIVVPDSVTVISEGAFAGANNLQKLTVPFIGESRDVKTDTEEALFGYWFGYLAYSGYNTEQKFNDGMKTLRVYIPGTLRELAVTDSVLRSNALQNVKLSVLNLGAGVTEIQEYAANNLGLNELNFDKNIKISNIPDESFTKNKLTKIVIPKTVKKIGAAFGTNQLAEIVLNDGLEIIDGSFINARVTSIDFPDSLIEIGDFSFKNCPYLEYVEFPENLKKIGTQAFIMNRQLKEVVFSNSITDICGSAFYNCPVKKVVMPEGMEAVVEFTFRYCDELEVVVIGGNVEEIGPQAFADCPLLETVVIPDSVTSISDDAFENASEDLVIYCNEGSYAQIYATQNSIKYTTLVIDPIENQTYTGKEIKPEVNASANSRKLTQDTEYSVSYKDNINAGSAKAIVKGLGDFKHLAATAKFTILPQGVENISVINDSPTYSPNGVKPKIYVYNGVQKLVEGQDYEILNNSVFKDAGEYNIAVSLIGNYDGIINVTYKVARKSIKQAEFMYGDTVKIICDGVTLEEGKDFIVTKETNEDGDVVTTVEGIGNYKGTHTHTEDNKTSGDSEASANWFVKLINLIKQFFERLFNIGA